MKKETYVAVILYKGSSTWTNFTPVFEEVTLIIDAESTDKAKDKAKSYGENNQPKYKNETGDEIKWNFMKVESVNLILEEITSDITPIHSRYFQNMEAYSKFREIVE